MCEFKLNPTLITMITCIANVTKCPIVKLRRSRGSKPPAAGYISIYINHMLHLTIFVLVG